MTDFLVSLLNMSLVSSWVIIALLILRPFMKKVPRSIVCGLWILVGIRLVCPVGFQSFLSFIPTSEPLNSEVLTSQADYLVKFSMSENIGSENIISNTLVPPAGTSINPMQAISLVAAFIWAVGLAVMLIISLVSYCRLNKSVRPSLNIGGNVYINDDIPSPFVLGFIKPRIYILSSLTEYEREFVIAHENAHIKRRDYLLKPIGYLILSLHWFNPLVWVAYIMLCRDIESACDEQVIRDMDENGKKNYSEILLRLSVSDRRLRACPVAFGETGVKSRIKSVVSYKKPALWIVAVALVLAAVLSLGFLTNPVKASDEKVVLPLNERVYDDISKCVSASIVDSNKTESADVFRVENYVELLTKSNANIITKYIWAYYGEFKDIDGKVFLEFESYKPAKVTILKCDGGYKSLSYRQTENYKDISYENDYFPEEIHSSVKYTPGYFNDQKESAMTLAKEYYGVDEKHNELFPVFNAEVLEVTDRDITVEPLKGELVSGKALDKVKINRNSLNDYEVVLFTGDVVRIRYADVITYDSDVPILCNVFHVELISDRNTNWVTEGQTFTIFSNATTDHYFREPQKEDTTLIYDFGEVSILTEGTYFMLNEENQTFVMVYENNYKTDNHLKLTSGRYQIIGNNLILLGEDPEVGSMIFVKNGDSYVYCEQCTLSYNGFATEYFKDGDRFVFDC